MTFIFMTQDEEERIRGLFLYFTLNCNFIFGNI